MTIIDDIENDIHIFQANPNEKIIGIHLHVHLKDYMSDKLNELKVDGVWSDIENDFCNFYISYGTTTTSQEDLILAIQEVKTTSQKGQYVK